jgi:hypothetical protein
LELLNSPDFYKSHDHARVIKINTGLEELEKKLEEAYNRWNELEKTATKFAGN